MNMIACPSHDANMTPAQARELAVDLVLLADDAEGGRNPRGFVTRWEVLAEMHEVRAQLAALLGEQPWGS